MSNLFRRDDDASLPVCGEALNLNSAVEG